MLRCFSVFATRHSNLHSRPARCSAGRARRRPGECMLERLQVSWLFSSGPLVSRNKLLCDWEWSAKTKGARGDFQSWRGLFSFVFAPIHLKCDVAHHLQIESVMIGDLLRAAQILNVGLQDAVQHVVGRQAVLILLIGPQFGRWRLLDG